MHDTRCSCMMHDVFYLIKYSISTLTSKKILLSVLCLNKMAEILGFTEDPAHWNETVNMQNLHSQMENQWELETPGW